MTVNDAAPEQRPPDTACVMFVRDANGVVESFALFNLHSIHTGPLTSAVMQLMTNHGDELDALYRKEANVSDHRNG